MADETKGTEVKSDNTPKVSKQSDSNIIAALSYLWILSVVIYVLKKDDKFIVFHARQAMIVFGISVIGWATSLIMGIGVIISIVALVLIIIGALKAYKGEWYKLPVIADYAEKINF